MDENYISKAESYLNLYSVIKQKASGNEQAAVAVFHEIAKDIRVSEMKQERDQRNGDLATKKQLAYLKKLGIKMIPGMTKKQASELIDNAKGNDF